MEPVKHASTESAPGAGSGVPRAGQLIGDRYRLDRPLERGAMGSVWRAEQVRLRAPVAVKFLDPSLIGDKEMHDRFIQEARSAAAVRSAHVVQVFDYGSEGGVPYIAMELLDGENLESRLNSRGPLTAGELLKLFTELSRGIGQAHAIGVIHRDLKPGNIFLAREGEHEVTKIVDFGIAKVKASALRMTQGIGTQLGILLGTPQYMSPEQVRGAAIDHRTDLWALGVIAYECLTGRCPFAGTTIGDLTVQICTEKPPPPSSLAPVPPGFDQWFFKATQKKAHKRFQTVEEMTERLVAVLAPAAAAAGAGRPARLIALPSRSEVRLAYSAVVTWKGAVLNQIEAVWLELRCLMQRLLSALASGWAALRGQPRPSPGSSPAWVTSLRPLVARHGLLASVTLLCSGVLLLGLTARRAAAPQVEVVPLRASSAAPAAGDVTAAAANLLEGAEALVPDHLRTGSDGDEDVEAPAPPVEGVAAPLTTPPPAPAGSAHEAPAGARPAPAEPRVRDDRDGAAAASPASLAPARTAAESPARDDSAAASQASKAAPERPKAADAKAPLRSPRSRRPPSQKGSSHPFDERL